MTDNSFDKDELIRQLMADRDRLFRENSRLRSAADLVPEEKKQNYKEQLAQKETIINKNQYNLKPKMFALLN